MRRIVWAVVTAALLATAHSAAADEWDKSFSVTGRPDLHIVADDGSVQIDTWDQKVVGLHVTTRGRHIGPNAVRIEAHQVGNRVDLEVRAPHWHWNIGLSIRSIRIEVRLPREADLDVHTGDGSVAVHPISGTAKINTGDGSISVEGFRGELILRSGDGRIQGTNLDGSLKAHTGDGSIHLDGRFDGLQLASGDGSITIEARSGSRIKDAWSVETGDGPLVVRIPADFKADLDAHTGDGRITLEIPTQVSGRISRSTVRGSLNGGGPPLFLRSGDGSIRIERL